MAKVVLFLVLGAVLILIVGAILIKLIFSEKKKLQERKETFLTYRLVPDIRDAFVKATEEAYDMIPEKVEKMYTSLTSSNN